MFHTPIITLVAIVLASLVLTQTNTTTLDPNTVSSTVRSQWCQSQINTCGILCSDSVNSNACDADTLTYDCTCTSNNSSPDLAAYSQTLPTFICEQLYSNCISTAGNNASAQAACQANIEDDCGKLDPADFAASQPSSSSSSQSSSFVSSTILHTTSSSGPSPGSSLSTNSRPSSTSNLVPTSSSSSAQNLGSVTALSPSTSPSATSVPTGSTGLTTGDKAGIGIGVTIGVLLLCFGGYLLGRLHLGVSAQRTNKHPDVPELSTNALYEVPQLETKERPGELAAAAIIRRHELQ
ncbi:hypothetical protein EG329_006675 [Mollisiaceae sp. DMI_Dod_QoI]|nr:hypothetical protein EG329_006675 [Helotiales sp. DMI_Dod_QoI]